MLRTEVIVSLGESFIHVI